MWFIQPKQDYAAQMPWKHADEPALMAWQIRARNYNTFIANILFFILLLVFLLMSIWFGFAWGFESMATSALVSGGALLFSLLMTMSMTHQTAIIVYRLTDKRIEVFSWKPQIDSVKPVMTWTAIGSSVVVLFLVFIDPAFIIAAIGPVGIGIAAALMGTSKSYQSMVRNHMEDDVDWREAKKIYAYHDRNIIGLNLYWDHPDTGEEMNNFVKSIFVPKEKYQEVLGFFKRSLPDVAVVEGKFDVYHV